jgi:hypothetical protein
MRRGAVAGSLAIPCAVPLAVSAARGAVAATVAAMCSRRRRVVASVLSSAGRRESLVSIDDL